MSSGRKGFAISLALLASLGLLITGGSLEAASQDTGRHLTVMSDGRIVAVGWGQSQTSGAVYRYTSTGALDTTFNSTGIVYQKYGTANTAYEYGYVQTDNKIVTVGETQNSSGYNNLLVSRFNADGSLDTSFDSSGSHPGHYTYLAKRQTWLAYGLDVQDTDGKIVYAAYTTATSSLIGRLTSAGVPDTSTAGGNTPFNGSQGKNTDNLFAYQAVAVLANGDILAGGDNNSAFGLARYTPNGLLDTTWRGGGHFLQSVGTSVSFGGMQVDATTGKITIGGVCNGFHFCFVRFNSDGSVDTTVGGGKGYNLTSIYGYPWAVFTQADGKTIMTGWGNSASFSLEGVAVVRFNGDGSVDTTYNATGSGTSGGPGYLYTNFGAISDTGWGGALAPSGQYIVTGASVTTGQFGLAFEPN